VPVDETRLILGLTAAEVYQFDLAALAPHVDRARIAAVLTGVAARHGAEGGDIPGLVEAAAGRAPR